MLIPNICWKRPIDYNISPEPKSQPTKSKFAKRTLPLLLTGVKSGIFEEKKGKSGISSFYPGEDRSIQGVSIGGLGAGTIGRSYRGDFCRWQLFPGKRTNKTVFADQFAIRIRNDFNTYSNVCCSVAPESKTELIGWNWNMPGSYATYHALYPRAWTSYKIPNFKAEFVCKQITPIIAQNYQESSYPLGIFLWEIQNTGPTPIECSVLLTWQNGTGSDADRRGGAWNEAVVMKSEGIEGSIRGIEMHYPSPLDENGSMTFMIAALEKPGVRVSYHTTFNTMGSGEEIWDPFVKTGALSNQNESNPSQKGSPIGGALCVTARIPADSSITFPMVIAWDIPIMTFGDGRQWFKRYTKFFGSDGQQIKKIIQSAFQNYSSWDQQIEKWQKPILTDPNISDWLKMTLLQELYYIADGGTHWEAGEVRPDTPSLATIPNHIDDIGRFGLLESFDFPFSNSFIGMSDAGFALAQWFPEIKKAITIDFIHALLAEDLTLRPTLNSKDLLPKKVKNAIPYDLGTPADDPWYKINFNFHSDSNNWRDLNTLFILQVYYDYLRNPRDKAFLEFAWPAVEAALGYLEKFDADHDGMIEHCGDSDQWYDTWPLQGISAYGGGLWITANAAAARIAKILGKKDVADIYYTRMEHAKAIYEAQLWCSAYYMLDTTQKPPGIIMSDQLAGHWWAHVLDLEEARLPEAHVKATLQKIFDLNVIRFAYGELGAVNGILPNGKLDDRYVHAPEVSLGTSFRLASLMLWEKLDDQGFKTAYGVYFTTYESGFMFRTPEAWDHDRKYRTTQNVCPLAVWTIYDALKRRK